MTNYPERDIVWKLRNRPTDRTNIALAADEIERLREQNNAWMNGVADVVEPLGYDRHAACGPADLLPGLTELRVHGMELARQLARREGGV